MCGAADEYALRAALHFGKNLRYRARRAAEPCSFELPPALRLLPNARIANGRAGADISVARLARIFLELQEKGALNINLVTATHYVPHAIEALRQARNQGLRLPVVWNTSGYETVETVSLVAPYVQTFLTDFRYTDPETARAYSHAPDYPHVARAALEEMVRGDADVIVRILALPGHIDEAKDAVRYLYETYGDRVVLSMMSQYTPAGSHPEHPELDRRVFPEEFEELLDFADAIGCDEYFWQEGDAAQESFIPDFYSLEGVLGPE
ncbi:MAG: radical SAM protein [Slackia sp.]